MYKVNLDAVWNLPAGVGSLEHDGRFCALGKVVRASLEGDIFVDGDPFKGTTQPAKNFLNKYTSRESQAIIDMNDGTVPETADIPFDTRHERAIRMALEIGLRRGFLELEDSDLDIVKELKSISPAPVEV